MGGEDIVSISDESLEQHIVSLIEKLEIVKKECSWRAADGGWQCARAEARSPALWRAVLAECAASFLYVLCVCGAAGGAGVGASTSAVLLATALATGCVVATLSLCFQNISGAHLNPAVSLAMCLRRRVSPLRAALYVIAQCGGAIAGAATLYGVTVPGYQGNLTAAMWAGSAGAAAWERLAAELALCAMLVSARLTHAPPALLGAAYCACTFVSMPYLNPARALGPAFVLGRWDGQWAAWAGALAGGAGAALLQGRHPHHPHRPHDPHDKLATYCAAPEPAPAPRRDPEPLYGGTRSLYCRSPPPARHTLHRSQSVYSKAGSASAPLAPAQSLLLRPHAQLAPHVALVAQNAHNAQRDVTHAGLRPGPTGAPVQERRESLYGTRRPDDGAYGYRPPPFRHEHY